MIAFYSTFPHCALVTTEFIYVFQIHEKISEKMMSNPVEVLCKGFPAEFAMYLNYCRGPDYMYLRQMFKIHFVNGEDRIMNCADFEIYHNERVKVSDKTNNIRKDVTLSSEKNKFVMTAKVIFDLQAFMDQENSAENTIDKNIEAALESNISDTFTQGGNLSLNDLNSLEANEKAALKFAIECSHSVQDGIMNCADFETYLNERVKVSNKPISRFGCRFHVKSE